MKNLWICLAAWIISSPGLATDTTAICIERAQAHYAVRLRAAMTELQAAFDRCGTSIHPSTDRCYQVANRRFDTAETIANEQLQSDLASCR